MVRGAITDIGGVKWICILQGDINLRSQKNYI